MQYPNTSSIMFTCQYEVDFLRAIWLIVYFRVRIAKNVLICKPDPKNNKYKIWFKIFRSQKGYFSFFIHLLQNYLQINIFEKVVVAV